MNSFDYDLFVIGGGSGGVRAGRVAASLGARVALAEERYLGGTCVNVGCVPKKLFSLAAHYRDDFEDSRGFGWNSPGSSFVWSRLLANKNREIARLNQVYRSLLEDNGVTLFETRARLAGPHRVEVDGKQFSARHILLAVGGWPWVPDYPGSEYMVSSNELFHLKSLPESIVVTGGGYIAVEFASIFARLGVRVSLVYRRDLLLRGFDEEIRRFISAAIGRHVDLHLEDDIEEITKQNKKIKVKLESKTDIDCAMVLAATGRRPMTAGLGLDTVGVKLTERGAIVVNERFETSEPGIYAVGDVIERLALTPVALAEGEIVARSLFPQDAHRDASLDYRNVPTAVFCHPNVGSVGLSEQQALAQGYDAEVYTATPMPLKHTLSGREERAMLKLVVDGSNDRVLGLHMVGADAGELVQGFAVAMNCGATKADFDRTIGVHPTLAEEFVTLRNKRKAGQMPSGS